MCMIAPVMLVSSLSQAFSHEFLSSQHHSVSGRDKTCRLTLNRYIIKVSSRTKLLSFLFTFMFWKMSFGWRGEYFTA